MRYFTHLTKAPAQPHLRHRCSICPRSCVQCAVCFVVCAVNAAVAMCSTSWATSASATGVCSGRARCQMQHKPAQSSPIHPSASTPAHPHGCVQRDERRCAPRQRPLVCNNRGNGGRAGTAIVACTAACAPPHTANAGWPLNLCSVADCAPHKQYSPHCPRGRTPVQEAVTQDHAGPSLLSQ